MDLRSEGFTVGKIAIKATLSKMAKHKKACIDNQRVFVPFSFDTFGFLAPENGSGADCCPFAFRLVENFF